MLNPFTIVCARTHDDAEAVRRRCFVSVIKSSPLNEQLKGGKDPGGGY